MNSLIPLDVAVGAGLGVLFAVIFYFLWRRLRTRILKKSFGRILLLVKVPKETVQTGPGQPVRDFKTEINRFEQLLGNLGALNTSVTFEIAVPHVGEEIHFYIAVPRRLADTAGKQIQGIWNGASVEAADDFSVFNPQGAASAAYFRQKENYALPIRTYLEIDTDTANSILGGFARVAEIGEGAALQIIIKPVRKRRIKKTMQKALESLKKGYSAEQVLSTEWKSVLKGAVKPAAVPPEAGKVVDEEAVKALTAKLSKPLFLVNARIVASAPSPFQAGNILEGIAAGFEQFASPVKNDLRLTKPRNPQNLIYKFIFREFDNAQSMILTSEEVASIYHFPTAFTETPKIKWLKSKEAPPPPNMPASGTLLGESVFRGERHPVYITDDDRRRHVYAIGQTGTGKTTLLSGMIVEDIRHGKGVALIDPHVDVVDTILGHIPKERAEDVIVFDPGDLQRPLGMNMLDYNLERPEEKTFIVNEMLNIFDKLYDLKTTGGPMFEQYMRNALLLLMEDAPNEPATLMEVPRIFTDADYRARKLARIHNAIIQDFWQKEAVKAGGEASLANMTPYITSKFNNFICNDYVRPIIGQVKSAFNFREAMDSGKILLVKLSKGKIGDANAGLLGMVITGKILMAALSRGDMNPADRRDFCLYIDEFQNFATDSIATILSEARKYGLCLTAAHQFIAQLQEKIRDAVFGNVGTQVVFRVGAQDSEFLVKQFDPVFSQNDLVSIDNLNAHVRLLINGQTSKPFNMHVLFLPPGNAELAAQLKEYSRLKYGLERHAVEEGIFQRLRA